jgi:hypothetical protein
MSELHWRWLTDLTFKCRDDEVHPHSRVPKIDLEQWQEATNTH